MSEIKSKPQTKEFDNNFDQIFGKREVTEKRESGRFVWDDSRMEFVPVAEYVDPKYAKNDNVMVDRFYEGSCTTVPEVDAKGLPTGRVKQVDIGSRGKHREFMRQNNLTTADDYTETWQKGREAREQFFETGNLSQKDQKERREQIGKVAYELEMGRRRASKGRRDF